MAFDTLIKGGTVYDGEHANLKFKTLASKMASSPPLVICPNKRRKPLMLMAPSSPCLDRYSHYDGQVTWDQEMDHQQAMVSARLSWVTAGWASPLFRQTARKT